jgi:hypothetical protein
MRQANPVPKQKKENINSTSTDGKNVSFLDARQSHDSVAKRITIGYTYNTLPNGRLKTVDGIYIPRFFGLKRLDAMSDDLKNDLAKISTFAQECINESYGDEDENYKDTDRAKYFAKQ